MTTSTFSPPTKLFIAGQWVDGPNKVTVRNKYTGEIAHELSGAGPDEVNRAVAAAKAAFPLMASMPIYKRADILRKTSELLAQNRAEIAKCVAREVGKAVKYAGFEVDRAVDTFRLAAEEAAQIHGETIPIDAVKSGEGLFGFWHRKPLGVVGAITPFNFPLNLAAHKIAPALAAGNTVVIKPSEVTSASAIELARLDKKNALTGAMYGAMAEALARAEADAQVRAILIHGTKDCFTAGNDLKDFLNREAGGASPS